MTSLPGLAVDVVYGEDDACGFPALRVLQLSWLGNRLDWVSVVIGVNQDVGGGGI